MLLGAKPEAPLDETMKHAAETPQREATERRERVAAAGGEMLGAAFKFLGELVASQAEKPAEPAIATDLRNRLAECVEEDANGRPRLTVTLPDRAALNQLADCAGATVGGWKELVGASSLLVPMSSPKIIMAQAGSLPYESNRLIAAMPASASCRAGICQSLGFMSSMETQPR